MSRSLKLADELLSFADRFANRLRQLEPHGDVIDQILAGGLLTTEQAADVCERDKETIRRWCEDADQEGRPLGIKLAKLWLVGTDRLFEYVEQHQDKHARLVAESRAKKYALMWSSPQQSLSNLPGATD
ncbi:hypothetical protein [Bradyrhizobium erythrophlei]|jgi:hypothetical protein|uniref:Uncharacterized protein n=1 Tax=Bradyrhizobium erythrophlei TaxID=1437360 RepID=A0A1M5QG97_9BRAD|nr:hypothetical protein [Bradyrhizobium erythrophlei]SHH12938.1 hypothetical protein SAMN05444169_5909 [Bradyrhizobium erythrophlei]